MNLTDNLRKKHIVSPTSKWAYCLVGCNYQEDQDTIHLKFDANITTIPAIEAFRGFHQRMRLNIEHLSTATLKGIIRAIKNIEKYVCHIFWPHTRQTSQRRRIGHLWNMGPLYFTTLTLSPVLEIKCTNVHCKATKLWSIQYTSLTGFMMEMKPIQNTYKAYDTMLSSSFKTSLWWVQPLV